MRFLVAALAAGALAVPSLAHAVSFPVACKALTTEQVKATRITVTKKTGCTKGREALRHWVLSGFKTKELHRGYRCRWDTYGSKSRRGRCVAGKNGGIAATFTERAIR